MPVPTLLSLRSPWLWLAIVFLSTPDGPQWWLAIAVVAASWAVPGMRHVGTSEDEPLHPLAANGEPWPNAMPSAPNGRPNGLLEAAGHV